MTQSSFLQRSLDRRAFLQRSAASALGLMSAPYALAATKSGTGFGSSLRDELARGFQTPPSSAKPQCFWHWMDGNVSKEGITADLEAMHEIGLGGTLAYDISYQIPSGKVHYWTPEWLEMMRHAAAESERLGLEMGMHNCSGWSSSGGPWITPEHGMKKMVWSETRATKGQFTGKLPQPLSKFPTYYHDIAVLACRNPSSEGPVPLSAASARISSGNAKWPATPPPTWPGAEPQPPVSSDPIQDLNTIRGLGVDITLPGPAKGKPQYLLLSMEHPFTAQSVFFDCAVRGDVTCEVQVSDDGDKFKTVATEKLHTGQPCIHFPRISNRFYRLFFTSESVHPVNVRISSIDLIDGYRMADSTAKAGFDQFSRWEPLWDETPPDGTIYKEQDIIDVSAFLKSDESLDWKVPEGDWTILRFGYAPTGQKQAHPEQPTGVGLEVDKLDKSALDIHFEHMTKVMVETMGPLSGKTFKTLLIDSYEVGAQNWTAKFGEVFQQKMAYDLIPNLPMFTGRIVGSMDKTERVLWDVRKTISDMFVENYFQHFRELSHQYGLQSTLEPYTGPFDLMDAGDTADIPSSEFWGGRGENSSSARTRMVVSVSHLNGIALSAAEAFTSGENVDKYNIAPYDLKALGDFQFSEGVNRFVFHRYAMQPWLDKKPGMTMGPWGIHMDRTQTWWKQGHDWITYITRSQFLLQSGTPVADILAFFGEDGELWPRWDGNNLPPIPAGYDFEYVNTTHLLAAKVDDGNIVLSNGLAYRFLLLPDARQMTAPLAKKLLELVKAGAVISGPPPTRTQTFSHSPESDKNINALTAELWGNCDGKAVTERTVSRGKVFYGKSIVDIFTRINLAQDFAFEKSGADERIVYKHRKEEDLDVFFVSNQHDEQTTITAKFRVSHKVPELWHADTGHIELAPMYREESGYTFVPLQFDPSGAVFVVFRDAPATDHAVSLLPPTNADYQLSVAGNSLALYATTPGTYSVSTAKGRKLTGNASESPIISLDEDWTVHFPPNLGAPPSVHLEKLISLSSHSEAGVRYFSGTCMYSRDVMVTPAMLTQGNEVVVDLGNVQNLAQIRVNGADFGVRWKPPYRADITKVLKAGSNRIEIEITNNWINRLIGDEQLPDDCEWIAVPGRGWRLKEWPQWFVENKPRPSHRIAFATWRFHAKDDALPASGLIGPVKLIAMTPVKLS